MIIKGVYLRKDWVWRYEYDAFLMKNASDSKKYRLFKFSSSYKNF